jgi:hypothetical protein
MQHFDNGHLPEAEGHFVDEFVQDAKLAFLVGVEAIWLSLIAFGAMSLFRWLAA